jgi:fructose-bisphosphate aldolase, class II
MKNLKEIITEAEEKKVAVGHFNFSNLEGLRAIFRAAEKLSLPVVVGLSEGERDFVGVRQAAVLVKSLREEHNYPIFLNADHTYSFERVKEVVDAGFDAVIIDGSKLPLDQNIKLSKQCVEYAKSKNPNILVEGELGYIGASSKMLDEIPADIDLSTDGLVKPEVAKQYVEETGVDLLSPAVGNIHGMLKGIPNPHLNIELIRDLRAATGVPLVLHGGSGITADDFRAAISAGISLIHINTELRLAYRDGLRKFLQDNPDEVAPYKILSPAERAMEVVATERLKLFNNL